MFRNDKHVNSVLNALGEQLDSIIKKRVELLICGGSALISLGLVQRVTKDVDVLAYVDRDETGRFSLTKADPLKPEIITASKKVAADFNLPETWLNSGPASAVDLGLPEGVMDRVVTRSYGKKLSVHFFSRYDQIHFKFYATADQGAGKHFDDLLALNPTSVELTHAARWCMTHDTSEEFRQIVKSLLNHMGNSDVAKKL